MEYKPQRLLFGQRLVLVSDIKLKMNTINRSTGLIVCRTKSNKPSISTGILISKDLILTAAHTIYDLTQGQFSDFRFYLGANGKIKQNYFQIKDFRYPSKFKEKEQIKYSYDFALMKIELTPSNHHKYEIFPQLYLTCFQSECIRKEPIMLHLSIFGYPKSHAKIKENSDKQYQNLSQYEFYQCGQSKQVPVEFNTKNKMLYCISTEQGQSGCAVSCEGMIFGIHLGSSSQSNQGNVGRFITPQMIGYLKQWQQQMNGDSFNISPNSICCHLLNKSRLILNPSQKMNSSLKLDRTCRQSVNALPVINKTKMNSTNRLFPQIQDTKIKSFYKKLIPFKEDGRNCNRNSKQSNESLILRGTSEFKKRNYQKALYIFEQCVQTSQYKENDVRLAEKLQWIGRCEQHLQNFEQSIQKRKKGAKIYKQNSVNDKYLQTCRIIGNLYKYGLKDIQNAIQWYNQALKIAQKGYQAELKDILIEINGCFHQKQNQSRYYLSRKRSNTNFQAQR